MLLDTQAIKEILMRRDKMSELGAEDLITEAMIQFDQYMEDGDLDSAYNICEEYFGLEPDYLI